MNNAVFGKTMENMRKYGDIELVTTERRGNHLVSEPNHYTAKFFTEHLLAVEMKKKQIPTNKPVYLALSILELSKILIYEFWYDYKKVIGLIKEELGRKIKFVGLRARTYSYLIEDGSEDIKAKAQKSVVKRKPKFENFKNCLEATELDNKINLT